MTIQKIKCFLDVASFMSFTKAAEKNYISQTAISQQIIAMESELGFKLFCREKGRISFTDAGQSFYESCEKFIKDYESAVALAIRINDSQNGTGRISLGFLTSMDIGFLDSIIALFHETYPNISIRFVQGSFVTIRKQLENGTLDIGLCSNNEVRHAKDISTRLVLTQKMGFLVSKKSHFAERDFVYMRELDNERTILISKEYGGAVYDEYFKIRAVDGVTPKVVDLADSAEVLQLLVSLNRGGAYLPIKTSLYDRERCKLVPISGSSEVVETVLAWRNGTLTEPMKHLCQLIEEFFANGYDQWLLTNR